MKNDADQKRRKLQTITVFVSVFIIVNTIVYIIDLKQIKEEKLQAGYTAETTINRIESQINQYLAEFHLVKHVIEDGGDLGKKEFDAISKYMQDNEHVIEAHELAKDGIVSQIYPLEGNEEAIGLDMLKNPARKKEAHLAKLSGQYTIAGPYELVQGGMGALLFDPVYTKGADGEKQFWGFSILVINWQRLFGFLISIGIAFVSAIGFWQFQMRQYKDQVHAQEIEKSARIAKQANDAKTRFLFNMGHDIRTPMNAIIGFSELLEKHVDEPKKVKDYIKKIKASSSLLLSLINYVLEMARIESGEATLKEEIVNLEILKEMFDTVFEPTVKEKKLSYSCKMDIEHFYVICDKTKVREILINIVSNSVKYTQKGGKVMVNIIEEEKTEEGCASYRFIIEDTGIGMSEEYLPHIFEEFTREHTSTESKVVGTGLGLPIVKALVDLMGGTIDVESKVGKGTKFTVVLPLRLTTEEQFLANQKQKKAKRMQEMKGKRILLAEDNDLNAEIAMTILQESGFEVEHAQDGVICMEMLKEKPFDYYDVILMDIQMPNMDGYQTTKEIRRLEDARASIPIVAMTANAFEEDRKKAFDVGMDGYITKPMTMDVLFATLEEVLWL